MRGGSLVHTMANALNAPNLDTQNWTAITSRNGIQNTQMDHQQVSIPEEN